MTHFSKFDNKRDGKRAGWGYTPSELFSGCCFFSAPADRCHLKLQRYFLIVKGRAGGKWRDRGAWGLMEKNGLVVEGKR